MNYILLSVITIIGVLILITLFILYRTKSTVTVANKDLTLTANIYGHTLHYTIDGKGPSIVQVHGIGASHYVWRYLNPLLKDHFTIIAIDLLGFGASDKPTDFQYDLDSQTDVILEFLKYLKIKKTFLLGSSMGGTICLRLAQMEPSLFPKVVVVSPAADPRISIFDINRLSFVSPLVSPIVGQRFIKQILNRVNSDSKKITTQDLEIYSKPYSQPEAVRSFIKSFALLRDRRTYENLGNIQQPVLVLWGKKDKIISVKYAQKIISKLSNAKLEINENAGHHVQEDEPQWTSQKIIEFLN